MSPPQGADSTSNSTSATPLQAKDLLDYAWKWFQYHAGQRMLAFNFLLLLMGALSVGYYKARDSGSHGHAAIVAFFGVVVTLAFLILDLRNADLVQLGRDALKSLERLPEFASLSHACKLATCDQDRCLLKSHNLWLRLIESCLLAIFLFAGIRSVVEWQKEPSEATPQQTKNGTQMPYIKQDRRDAILAGAKPQNAGELNFAITVVVDNYLRDKGGIRYAHLNEVVGAMDCAKLELYRRLAAPYEDKKIKEAGDVYTSNDGGGG